MADKFCTTPAWTGNCPTVLAQMKNFAPPAPVTQPSRELPFREKFETEDPVKALQCYREADKARSVALEICSRKFDCRGWKPLGKLSLQGFLTQTMLHESLKDDNRVTWDDLARLSLILAEYAADMQRDQYCEAQLKK